MPDGQATEQGLLAQLLLEQGKQTTTLAVIETKLDNAISITADHEARLRSLEKFKWLLLGIWVAGNGISAFIGYYFSRH